MTDTPSRLFSLVAILIAVWVLVYWLYEPRPPKVTADVIPAGARTPVAAPISPERADRSAPPIVPQSRPITPESRSGPDAAAVPSLPIVVQTPPPIIEPQFRQYIVQPGDVSWEAIAQRIYGDRRMWSVIARANPLSTSDRLKPGTTVLNIPVDPSNIQGKPNPEAVPSSPSGGPAPALAPPKTAETTYIVQEGDTLWAIARRVYGKGAMWEVIYRANRDRIKDKDRPIAGTSLVIPPRPDE
ncbi:MAG: LysM peptidoglycan-binding domain-containing protein [Phycisphaerales bacterium]